MNNKKGNIKENSKKKETTNIKSYDDHNQKLEEVDIFSKNNGFDDKFINRMLNPKCKWNEKKYAFDRLAQFTEQSINKNIKNADRSSFIEMVKKLLKQPNIHVIHSIINALNNLSLCLKSDFIESKDLFPYLLNFLKEKKDSIINSLITCLFNFSLFINDNIINEQLLNYCSTKPLICNNAKINLCSFIEKLIENKNNIQLNNYIPLIIKIAKYLDDPNQDVRENIAKLMAFINYKKKDIFTSILNDIKLDNRKKNKIEEYEKFYINLSCNNTNKKNKELINNKKNENKNNSNLGQKNLGTKLLDNYKPKNMLFNNNDHYNITGTDNGISQTVSKNEINKYLSDDSQILLMKEKLLDNKEDIFNYIKKKIENIDISLFTSSNWKERKKGFSFLNNYFLDEKNFEEINNSYDYYFEFILINNNYFNEKIDMVLNESILCINRLIEKVKDFSEKYYKLIISLLINRLNEKKVVGEISLLIQCLVYKTSQNEIISTLSSKLKNKSNTILNEGIQIIKKIIDNSKNLQNNQISDKIQSKYNQIYSISKNCFLSNQKGIYDETQLPNSPLLSIKKNISKYNYNIIDVLPPEQSELSNYIKNLYATKDCIEKNLALTEIKKILIHSIEKNTINENQIKDILLCFNNLLSLITNNIKIKKEKIEKNEIILLRYLLDDYIFIAKKSSLINNLEDTNFIYNCYESLFLILSENKILVSIDYGSEILGIINTIILCLLTNFNKTSTIKVLIKIISIYKSNSNDRQILSFAIKCLEKLRKILPQIKNKIDNNSIFISLYDFFIGFENKNMEPNNENEKIALLMINSLITEYINIYNNSIWDIYHESLDNDMLKLDIYFKRTIEILLKNINSSKYIKSKKDVIEDNSNNEIENIMFHIQKLKTKGDEMTNEEKINCYCEIVRILRMNKINISILSNKIDGDIFAKILDFYYSISSSKTTKGLSQNSQTKQSIVEKVIKIKKIINTPLKKNEKFKNDKKINNNLKKNDIKNPKKGKEITESKRILDYKNKIKYLTESSKNRNQKTLEKENNENKPINTSSIINSNQLVEKTIKQIDEISLNNKDQIINKKVDFENSKINEIINMKKKLEEIRNKLK